MIGSLVDLALLAFLSFGTTISESGPLPFCCAVGLATFVLLGWSGASFRPREDYYSGWVAS